MIEQGMKTTDEQWEDATRILRTLTPRERAHWRDEIPTSVYSHLLQVYTGTPTCLLELILTYLQAQMEPHPDHTLSLLVQASPNLRARRPTIHHRKRGSRGQFPIPRSSQILVLTTKEARFFQPWRLGLIALYLNLLSMALEQQAFEVRGADRSGKR